MIKDPSWLDAKKNYQYYSNLNKGVKDLQKLSIRIDGFLESESLCDNYKEHGPVKAIFRNLSSVLVEHIDASDGVVGCVAWLTEPKILDAMSRRKSNVIVQKEDFLRPDGKSSKNKLHEAYKKCMRFSQEDKYKFPNRFTKELNTNCTIMEEAVRCVGNHNSAKSSSFARSHHKFLVFLRDNIALETYEPYAVWTGSFNFTKNAGASFENAVVISIPEIAQAYLDEWAQIMALSEPLNWEHPWCYPEYRLGT